MDLAIYPLVSVPALLLRLSLCSVIAEALLLLSAMPTKFTPGGRMYTRPYKAIYRRPYSRYRRGMHMASGRSFATRVRKVVKAEVKFRDQGFSVTPIVGAQSEVLATNIDQGAGASNRIGNWLQPLSLKGNITVQGDDAAGPQQENHGVRVGYAMWKNDETNDAFTYDRIMQDGAAPGGPFSVPEKDSYKVLWTKYMTVNNHRQNSQFTKTFGFSINLTSLPRTLYDNANSKKNQIFFFAGSDDIVGANPPTVLVDSMLRFTDS